MTKQNKNGVITVGIVMILVVVIYFITKKAATPISTTTLANNIIANVKSGMSASDLTSLAGMQSGYLQAWATALQAGQTYFEFNGNGYATNGGEAVGQTGD